MNLTIYGIYLHLIMHQSAYFQLTQSYSSIKLQNSAFSHFVYPVIRINNIKQDRSLTVFYSVFKFSKALQMNSVSKCKSINNFKLNHQTFNSICINFEKCRFINCSSLECGGAVEVTSCNITFIYCAFNKCKAQFGGTIYSTHSKKMIINQSSIIESRAERFGAIYSDSKRSDFSTNITFTNITHSIGTIYIAGVRVETTQPNFQFDKFDSTFSPNFGAIWDWSVKPTISIYNSCEFMNVTSGSPGAAITLYHWLQQAKINNCIFHGSKKYNSTYIYLFSSESDILIENCYFDLPSNISIVERYNGNNITLTNNTFS